MEVKNSSKYFVDLIDQMNSNFDDLQSTLLERHNSYNKKLEIMNAVSEYNNYLEEQLTKDFSALKDSNGMLTVFTQTPDAVTRKNIFNANKILFNDYNKVIDLNSNYERYGNCVHPKVIGNMENVFNFNSAAGYIYKDTATITVNGESDFNDVLKHDTLSDKLPSFNQYTSDTVTLEIEVPSNSIIGSAICNAIEISPFLAGASVLKTITITPVEGTQLNDGDVVIDYDQPIEDTRILFDTVYSIKKITLTFRLLFTNNLGLYPFGLRHIYLLNANFDTSNSYITIECDYPNLIKYISDDVVISNQRNDGNSEIFSRHKTSCSELGIELYSYLSNGKLLYPIETRIQNTINQISRNTNKFYAKIPVKESLYSIEFSKVQTNI